MERAKMSIETVTVYENGLLKLGHPLPLEEHQRVKLVVETTTSFARRFYGINGWTAATDVVREIALEPAQGMLESP